MNKIDEVNLKAQIIGKENPIKSVSVPNQSPGGITWTEMAEAGFTTDDLIWALQYISNEAKGKDK